MLTAQMATKGVVFRFCILQNSWIPAEETVSSYMLNNSNVEMVK